MEEWLRVYTPPTKRCAELWETLSEILPHECSDSCHRGYEGASVCVCNIKVHIRIHWTCSQEVLRWFRLTMIHYVCPLPGVRWLTRHSVQQAKHKRSREYPGRWIVKRVSKISWPNECFIRKPPRCNSVRLLAEVDGCLPLSFPINPNIEQNRVLPNSSIQTVRSCIFSHLIKPQLCFKIAYGR